MMALFYMDDKYIFDHPPAGETCVCVCLFLGFFFSMSWTETDPSRTAAKKQTPASG